MNEIIKAIILGIIQGVTEFLPVSSSGHLIFLQKIGIGSPSVSFNIMMHLGTLLASIIALRKSILDTLKSYNQIIFVLLSCIPTFIIAAGFKFFLEDLLEGAILGVGFMITAIVLIISDMIKHPKDTPMTNKKALMTGVMQGIAVLPGISRSGMTIGFLRGVGIESKQAAEFSFLIAIPVIIGGALVEVLSYPSSNEWSVGAIIVGVVFAFISGYYAIRFMISIISRTSLLPFAVYVAILSILSFIVL